MRILYLKTSDNLTDCIFFSTVMFAEKWAWAKKWNKGIIQSNKEGQRDVGHLTV